MATQDQTLRFSFDSTSKHSHNVAATSTASWLKATLSTDAINWGDSLCTNGVDTNLPSGPIPNMEPAFRVHSTGTPQIRGPFHADLSIDTSSAFVLKSLSMKVASGDNQPARIDVRLLSTKYEGIWYPLTEIAIPSPMTATAINLSLNRFLPIGVSTIRMIAQAPYSAFVAYADITVVGYEVPRSTSAWEEVGSSISNIFFAGRQLYGKSTTDGSLLSYDGIAQNWSSIRAAAYQFVGSNAGVFAITDTKDLVESYTVEDNKWTTIRQGHKMSDLAAGHRTLYGLDAQGIAWEYDFKTQNWLQLSGGPWSTLSADAVGCVTLDLTNNLANVFVDGNQKGIEINPGLASLHLCEDDNLYALGKGGMANRWTGKQWSPLVSGFSTPYAPYQKGFFAIVDNYSTVVHFDGEKITSVILDGGSIGDLVANDTQVAVISNSKVMLYTVKGIKHLARRGPPGNPTPPDTKHNWVFKTHTMDMVFAGFDGTISLTVRDGSSSKTMPLEKKSFKRNDWDVMPMHFEGIDRATEIQLYGKTGLFTDTWYCDRVVAWSLTTQTMYEFDPNPLAIYGLVTCHLVKQTSLQPAPTYARIFIWEYLGLKTAVGHASILLSDGTYISWWPSGLDRKYMPLLKLTYEAPGILGRTYADDFAGEEDEEPYVVVRIYGLNESLIKQWWSSFAVQGAMWKARSDNCSKIVYHALREGGVMSKGLADKAAIVSIWTPEEVLRLALAISTNAAGNWIKDEL